MPPAKPSRKPEGELALIERIRTRAAAAGRKSTRTALRLGIGDDAALLRPQAGHEIVVTTDFSLEGRHFLRATHPAEAVGHRTLARGLSDLAAMGADPLAAFLSLAVPRALARERRWLDGFLDGLLALAAEHGVPLAGGDTSESPSEHLLADIVLIGSVPAARALRRDGACVGDAIYVSGQLGGSAAELKRLLGEAERDGGRAVKGMKAERKRGVHPHLFPEPRLALGQALRSRGLATAAMDLSDGLSTDLAHLCEASGVAAEIELARLPLSPLAVAEGAEEALRLALHGGEDYELLFTAAGEVSGKGRKAARVPRRLGGVALTRIGTIVAQKPRQPLVTQIDADGNRCALEPHGWEHLR